MTDPQTLADAIAAINALTGRRNASRQPVTSEDLAAAALSVIPEAVLEDVPMYALSLDTVDRDEAHFAAPGGFRLSMHRGEWMERGRPVRIDIAVQER